MAVLRVNFIFFLSLICRLVLCDSNCYPPPGQVALTYADGSFMEPNSVPSVFGVGAKLNISWTTIYPTSTLYMITGCNWNQPLQLAANVAQTWFEWVVQPMSNNASETYAFRVVDPIGNATEQQIGGFVSAAFFIGGQETSSSAIIATTVSSAVAPTVISTSVASSNTSANPHTSAAAETTPSNTSGNARTLGIGLGVGIAIVVFGLGGGIAGYCLRRRLKRRTSTKETRDVDPETYGSRIEQFKIHEIDHGTTLLREIDGDSAWPGAEAEQRTKARSTTHLPNVHTLPEQHYYELEQ
ncbi:hypothetical protein NA56DRAFT_642450 [Hyaloscypha hepaticicola]|uniref:Mid2 domain-containing protein n=1 Tax=Hyaloscypha hepaticicola TaxID=2082293 RepID=A0A2J6QGP8_9HELO|nr:hypothetical protein NA56DRAFT_642450 [Hyaloscypha hepaticicola]